MKYVMGIDNGGTFTKTAIFDEFGNQIAAYGLPTKTISPVAGWAERDIQELWDTGVLTIKECIRKAEIDASEIVGVSFSGHGKGLYVLGEGGNVIYNGIPSTDARAFEYVDKWRREGVFDRIYPLTFQEVLVSQPVSLLAWLKDHEPEVYHKIRYVFSVKDLMRFKLTGVANAEYTDFSGANLINLTTKEYDPEILRIFGIPEMYDCLPPLKYSADLSGFVTKEAAELTGLREGTPVAAGMFDINACGVASGLNAPDKLCMIAGTWSINEYISKKPITNGSIALNSMYCMPGFFLIEESSPTSAGNLEWFIKELLQEKTAEVEEKGGNIYKLIDNLVAELDPWECDLIFLPFLNGSNEDPLARGTFLGLTNYHRREHMAASIFEGVVFSHLTHLNKLLQNREKPKSIQLSGGVTNSAVWLQMFADILQIPIDVVAGKEQGAAGAAMTAGIAAGLYRDYEDAIAKCVEISRRVEPRLEFRELYEKKFLRYRAVIDALGPVWRMFGE